MKVLKALGSLRLAIFLIVALACLLAFSTIMESLHGTPFAQKHFYTTRWFDFFLALLWVNIFCSTLTRWPFEKKHIGFIITHLGILTLLGRSLGLNRVVADNYVSMYLASEGVEVVKNILDDNVIHGRGWNEGFADGAYEVDFASEALARIQSSPRTLSFDAGNHYGYGAGIATSFRRVIGIRLVGSDQIVVISTVSWETRGGGAFDIALEDHFFNWRP